MRKTRAFVCQLLVWGLCLLVLTGCLGQPVTASQVVQNAQQALAQMNACHLILEIEINTDMIKDLLVVEIWEKYPQQFKLNVLSASTPQLQGLVFTTDGGRSLSYSPHTNTATVGPSDVVHMPQVLGELVHARREWLQSSDPQSARLLVRERQDGFVIYKVQVPVGEQGSATYSIDVRQWWVRQVVYADEYLGTGTIRVQMIECHDDLDDSIFAPNIPEGAILDEVTVENNRPLTLAEAQMAVGFRVRIPSYLPPETDFAVAYQLDKNMALVYAGKHAFTLVQGPNIGQVPQENVTLISLRGQQAVFIRDEAHQGVLLTWREDDLQFSIAGSLDLSQVLQIAESLE